MQPTKQAAACCVELCDVDDSTIITIWRMIPSFLDTQDILSGMLVCKRFCKELPSLVSAWCQETSRNSAGGQVQQLSNPVAGHFFTQ
jgi:hypothetical protein